MAGTNLDLEMPEKSTLMKETAKSNRDLGKRKSQFKWYARQTVLAMGPIMGTLAVGMTTGYSAVLMPQLKLATDHNSSSTLDCNSSVPETMFQETRGIVIQTTEQESWVAAAGTLLTAPGCWIAGWLMEKCGRKISHLIISPIFLTSWIIIGMASNLSWLIVGRLLCGLCVGLHGPLGVVYIGETSHPRLRGILLSGISLAVAAGVLFVHALGTWLHWRLTAYLCAICPILCFLLCSIALESPQWLLGRRRMREAEAAWLYLRGEHCTPELEILKSRQIEDWNVTERQGSNWRTAIGSRVFLMPLLIINVFFLTAQFSGNNAVAFYSVQMLEDVSGPKNMYTATLILDAVRLIACFVACWLTRDVGRRPLTLFSGVGSSLALLALSTCLYWDIGKPWLPILFLFLFVCLVSLGMVPLPWLLCGELFAVSVRGLGSGLTSGFGFVCFFVVIKTGPIMFETLHTYGTFCVYGIVVLCGTIFLYFFLPETKDKTLQEIEEGFAKKTTRDKKNATI